MSYLVQFGRLAHVGRFTPTACGFETQFTRGERAVIRGPRGLELGTVLGEASDRFQQTAVDGELLRLATLEDFASTERNEALGQHILAATDDAGLPIGFIDIEVSLDAATAVLHGLPWSECDASPLFAELSDRFGLAVDPKARVEDITVGQQQRVEILKALYRNADILVLDEPTAVLTPQEARELFEIDRKSVV